MILPLVIMLLLTRDKISKLTAFPNGPFSYMFDKNSLQSNIKYTFDTTFFQYLITFDEVFQDEPDS